MPWVLAVIAVSAVAFSGPMMAVIAAPALAIAFWRNALGSLALAPLAAMNERQELRSYSGRELLTVTAAGVALALHFATWVSALKLTTVAAAIALVSTQVVWVVLIERVLGRPIGRRTALGVLVALCGVIVITGFDVAISTEALIGDLLGLAGGFFAAVYFVIGSRVRQVHSNLSYNVLCFAVSAVTLFVLALIFRQDLLGFSTRDWLLIVGVTVMAQLLGHFLLNHVLASLSATAVSLVILFEVPLAALIAGVLISQAPGWGIYLGIALILTGLVVVVVRRGDRVVPGTVVD